MLSEPLKSRIAVAVETDSLMLLCGAGLSMAAPSALPSAAKLARICFDKWRSAIDPTLDVALRDDLGSLASHLYQHGRFADFLRTVPWAELGGQWNAGHAAIADLLTCRAAFGALSANFDFLIEQWAEQHRGELQAATTGQEAQNFAVKTAPLLKFHGCARKKETTLWTEDQLHDAETSARIAGCKDWIRLSLPDKHVVVVGFWTDWKYLNGVIEAALTAATARSVTVVDLLDSTALETKAPALWNVLSSLSGDFVHLQASGAEVLDAIRAHFSNGWLKRSYVLGGAPITQNPLIDHLDTQDLYDLRRDAEGVDRSRAAVQKTPAAHASAAAAFQLLLLQNGAVREHSWFNYRGQTIRVVNGSGRVLEDVRDAFNEAPTLPFPDLVVCAGASDLAVPAKLIASGSGASAVRPAPGGAARWMTIEQARVELAL